MEEFATASPTIIARPVYQSTQRGLGCLIADTNTNALRHRGIGNTAEHKWTFASFPMELKLRESVFRYFREIERSDSSLHSSVAVDTTKTTAMRKNKNLIVEYFGAVKTIDNSRCACSA